VTIALYREAKRYDRPMAPSNWLAYTSKVSGHEPWLLTYLLSHSLLTCRALSGLASAVGGFINCGHNSNEVL
jgi:hypothetical protein